MTPLRSSVIVGSALLIVFRPCHSHITDLVDSRSGHSLEDRREAELRVDALLNCSQQIQDSERCNSCKTGATGRVHSSLNGLILKFATINAPPFSIVEWDSSGRVKSYSGYCFEILNILQELYNFTFTVESPKHKSTGIETADGSWNGIVGMLISGEADLSAAALSLTHSRYKVVDFTVPYYEESTAILIPPPSEESRLFACLKPFQWKVWVILFVVVTFLPLTLWFQSGLLRRIHQSPQLNSRDGVVHLNLFKTYCFVFAVISSQSGQKLSSIGHAPRFLAGVWCLCSVVFVHQYVSILVSVLSVPKLRPIVSCLEDLPSSGLEWGVIRGTSNEVIFKQAIEGIQQVIGEALIKRPELLVGSNTEAVERVANGSYAFMSGYSLLKRSMEEDLQATDQCRLSLTKEHFHKVNLAFAVAKSKWWLPHFDNKIQQMIEGGLTEYWRRMYQPTKNRCTDPHKRNAARNLNLTDLQSAFFILAIGLGLASLSFILELIYHRTCQLKLFFPCR